MWNGVTETALGKTMIKVKNVKTNKKWNVNYVIVENDNHTPLLSRKAAEAMKLVTVNYDNFDVCAVKTNKFKSEFPVVFDNNLGFSLGALPISLSWTHGPTSWYSPRVFEKWSS